MSFLINNATNPDLTNCSIYDKAFTNGDILKIEELQNKFAFEELDSATEQNNIFKYKAKWLRSTDQDCHWVFMKLAQIVSQANAKMWGFDLTGILEDLRYTIYTGGEGYHAWHMDIDGDLAAQRKISITVQLSDPEEYEGGELEFFNSANVQVAPKEKGTVVLFPSYMMHRVSPVTKGERKSLVLWVSGPPFR